MLNQSIEILSKKIAQAKGDELADIVIKDVKVLHLLTGNIQKSDIAICNDTIVGIGSDYKGKNEIKANGKFAVPGFIDSHVHIESALVTPHEFERLVLPFGTTTAICDPHELANVLGAQGFKYFLKYSENMIMDLRVQLSSCIPENPLSETNLSLKDLTLFLNHPNVIGLAEMMNIAGVINQDKEVLEKLILSNHIDGHCPFLSGKDLNAYISAGIFNDHEVMSYEEAIEKLDRGMRLFLREGSIAKDVKALSPLLDQTHGVAISFCTDDKNPLDIIENGHINENIKIALHNGASILSVYRAASYSAAVAFQLKNKGLIAPGHKADIVIMRDLEKCDPDLVICNGKIISEESFDFHKPIDAVGLNSIQQKKISNDDIEYSYHHFQQPIIKVSSRKLLTEKSNISVPGNEVERLKKDIIKVMVFERHGNRQNIGKAFCHGFGLKRGAIAGTVGHNTHNICVIGVNDEDITLAVNELIEMQGGYVIVDDEEVKAQLFLEIGGLISLAGYQEVSNQLKELKKVANELGCSIDDPFQQLSFITLSGIPTLKMTDQGLIDVNAMKAVL